MFWQCGWGLLWKPQNQGFEIPPIGIVKLERHCGNSLRELAPDLTRSEGRMHVSV